MNTSEKDSITTKTSNDTSLLPESYKGKDYLEIGFELLKTESLRQLKINLTAKETINLLGEPDKKSKSEIWGADGAYHQSWVYYSKGVELDIIGQESINQAINMITITKPCELKTKRRIGIGSSIDDVKLAYRKAINSSFSDSLSIVAGSIYGGIIFYFENAKVQKIFIGAAAE